MKSGLKSLARAIAAIFVLPFVATHSLCAMMFGKDRALESSTQTLSLLPGLSGAYLRTAFLRTVLAECHPSARIEFGVLLSKAGARIEENVYVGPRCCLGLVHLERNVLIAPGVQIPSGSRIHDITEIDRPIQEQPGEIALVRIGAGSWIGANAVVMADVGRNCVIGAGAVVTQPIPDFSVAGGVPARLIRSRAVSENAPQTRASFFAEPPTERIV